MAMQSEGQESAISASTFSSQQLPLHQHAGGRRISKAGSTISRELQESIAMRAAQEKAAESITLTAPDVEDQHGMDATQTNRSGTPGDQDPRRLPSKDPPLDTNRSFVEAGTAGFRGLPGFVQVEFQHGDSPLGIIVDWSMALPVACGAVTGTPASFRPALSRAGNTGAGLVLVQINGHDIRPKEMRESIQTKLTVRPLILLFERAKRIDFPQAPPPWKRPSGGGPTQKNPVSPPKKSLALTPAPARTPSASPNAIRNYLQEHPERSPLTRWARCTGTPPAIMGNTNTNTSLFAGPDASNMTMALASPSIWQPGSTLSHHGSTSLPRLPGLNSRPGLEATNNILNTRPTIFGGTMSTLNSRGTSPLKQVSKSPSLTQLSAPVDLHETADKCYQLAVDRDSGPGQACGWHLGHDAKYACRLEDMRLVRRLWDAYEVGFRGRKRNPPTDEELACGIFEPRKLTVDTANLDKSATDKMGPFPSGWCDSCGQDIGDEYLWFCRKCKTKGNRFELCLECHAAEVLQGEGKHSGRRPHPHLLRCQHSSLQRHTNISSAYPGLPHLKCLLCDLCGSHIPGLLSSDDRQCAVGPHPAIFQMKRAVELDQGAAKEKVGPTRWQPPGRGEVYVCSRCPAEEGVRFECCSTCAFSMLEYGSGLQRLTSLF
mmetsp:Transcript_20340/g.43400  ORF Transcript_20340/g.43400 Transcript_20340/m.43400 type:complete len:659 (+) Transcript_20340:313-2289(+)|eukprot:CAMPEP_0206471534 /NCGR_PEP_ID=MMETSP0324_2-20121206/31626_1 /ASSEMBLY_ACC=CAM_ASM_000836 /TAXON_ID=2866 /ORGANISM="Crypthecodinium cohnii, Strain Seligo" /LENGTH=658 /DNA_ID=CAMNT_0053945889 /DNA_START=250 /DNA_END=2226 /DNA_ORIENTATION=-